MSSSSSVIWPFVACLWRRQRCGDESCDVMGFYTNTKAWPFLTMMLALMVMAVYFVMGADRAIAFVKVESGSPCSCFWDGETKDNPVSRDIDPEPITQKWFLFERTRIHYACGYVCFDAQRQPQRLYGHHHGSYIGSEDGDEIVCDGLEYHTINTPTGDRLWTMAWDGDVWAFTAKSSTSTTIRDWAQEHCAGTPAAFLNGHPIPLNITGAARSAQKLPAPERTIEQRK